MKRLLSLLVGLFLLGSLFLFPQLTANAAGHEKLGKYIEVKLSGTAPSGVKVLASRTTREDDKYDNLTLHSVGSNTYETNDIFPWQGSGGTSSCQTPSDPVNTSSEYNKFTISVKNSDNQDLADSVIVNLQGHCGKTSTTIKIANTPVELGNIAGNIQIKKGDGSLVPLKTKEDGRVINSATKKVKPLVTDSDGNYTVKGLEPGKYQIIGDGSYGDPTTGTAVVGCFNVDGVEVKPNQTTPKNITADASTSASNTCTQVAAGGSTATGNDDARVQCENSGDPLGWFLCAVFNGVSGMADWLFHSFVQPFLVTTPISTDSNDPSFKVWSSFRIYGNIFLILALLILVIGQSVGGGLVDAYTVKKMVPRILIAAIMINLSIYIVNFLIDITNIVGGGLGQLMLAPLKAAGDLNVAPGAGQAGAIVFWTGFLGMFLAGATIAGILGALAFGKAAFLGKAAVFIVFTIVIPVVLAIIGVFVTLLLRRGIILLLILVSPVAFALYSLPNTDKYFKKWWDLLFKTLLVYPIVIAVFAVADLLSVAVMRANKVPTDYNSFSTQAANATLANPLAAVIAFVLQFLPLFLIPFAFKFAGGAVSALHGAITNGRARVHEMTKGRREQSTRDVQTRMLEGRGDIYNRLQTAASSERKGWRGRLSRGGARFVRDRVGGYNLEAALSQLRAEKNKELGDTIATGDDDEIRAFNTDRRLLRAAMRGEQALIGAGYQRDVDYRFKNGKLQVRNMSGKFYDMAEAQAGQQRWGGDRAALQKSYSYEIQKALLQDDNDAIASSILGLQQSWGMTDDQMNGILIGAGFEQQGKSKQWKRYTVRNGQLTLDGKGIADEQHGQMGTYQGLAQDADTFVTMAATLQAARSQAANNPLAREAQQKIEEFALRYDNVPQAQLQQQVQAAAQQAQQAALAAGQQYTGIDPTSSASADVAASIQELIQLAKTGQAGSKLQGRRRRETITFGP